MACISDIKLIRTDTTLDLSQKAEKNAAARTALESRSPAHIYICALVASAPVALAPARTPSAHASVHTERPTTPNTDEPPRHGQRTGQRQRPAPTRPPLQLRLLFLIVYALHNAWICWTFLKSCHWLVSLLSRGKERRVRAFGGWLRAGCTAESAPTLTTSTEKPAGPVIESCPEHDRPRTHAAI